MTWIVRWRYAVFAIVAAGVIAERRHMLGDWAFFVTASRLLRAGRWDLYVTHPTMQIGPVAVALAIPFTLFAAGHLVMQAVIAALGLACLRCAELTARHVRAEPGDPRTMLLGGLLFTPLWAFVVTSAHLDDALALAAAAVTCVFVSQGRVTAAGLALGFSCAAKPWAIVVIGVLMGLPGWRSRFSAAALVAAVPLLTFAPFLIAAPHTLSALAGYHLPFGSESAWHLLGHMEVGTRSPWWLRPVQLSGGAVVSIAVGGVSRWQFAVLAGFAMRVLLDPDGVAYYGAGVGLGALFADLLLWSAPLLTAAAALALALPSYLELSLLANSGTMLQGHLRDHLYYARLAFTATLPVGAVVACRRQWGQGATPQRRRLAGDAVPLDAAAASSAARS